MNIDYKLIGSRIKAERKKLGMSQDALAEKLNVSIGYVSQVERGITKISLDLLGAISSILSCDVAALITESAVKNENYLSGEILHELERLDPKNRKLVIEFIQLLQKNQ